RPLRPHRRRGGLRRALAGGVADRARGCGLLLGAVPGAKGAGGTVTADSRTAGRVAAAQLSACPPDRQVNPNVPAGIPLTCPLSPRCPEDASSRRPGRPAAPRRILTLYSWTPTARAVSALPERASMVVVLHDVEGYQHGEIAAMAGIAEGTSKAQLFRARRLLREALER